MSEDKNANTEAKNDEITKPVKKSWFNRVWSAVTGLIVGVAAMFGVNKAQVAEIKSEVQAAYDKVKEVQTAVENKDWGAAIGAATDAAAALKEVVGDVKDTVETVKDNLDDYQEGFEVLASAVEAKNWTAAKEAAVLLAKKITTNIPAEDLTGKTKDLYDKIVEIIDSLDNGKYDKTIETVQKVASWLPKKTASAATEATPEN